MKKTVNINFGLLSYFALIFVFSCSKGDDAVMPAPVAIIPQINIQDATQVRSTSGRTMRFFISSSKATTNAISVNYTLMDGTATASKDYVATSGTISIPANETQGFIDVDIKGDPTDLRQTALQFTVNLSNPVGCTIETALAKGTIINEDGTYLPTDDIGYITPLSYQGYTLAWSDEFSGTTLNSGVWNQEIGNNNGWGNNELEYYTNSLKNTFLSNGNLIIEARRESLGGYNYTSGRMTTQNKKHFKFGRIDIRAKLPVGKGIWPAIWMLGANISSVGWPSCGEIDIMELVGTFPSRVTGTMHWKGASGDRQLKGANYNLAAGDFSQKFHVFSIVWTSNSIKWYVDDQLFLANSISDVGSANYPFNADHFLLFNVAVGGDWPGPPDVNTSFPQRMFVDYVRVFQ